jgi:hypothetical protein
MTIAARDVVCCRLGRRPSSAPYKTASMQELMKEFLEREKRKQAEREAAKAAKAGGAAKTEASKEQVEAAT